jgi:hypothetical protein
MTLKEVTSTEPGHIHTSDHLLTQVTHLYKYIKYLIAISQTLNELFQVYSWAKPFQKFTR